MTKEKKTLPTEKLNLVTVYAMLYDSIYWEDNTEGKIEKGLNSIDNNVREKFGPTLEEEKKTVYVELIYAALLEGCKPKKFKKLLSEKSIKKVHKHFHPDNKIVTIKVKDKTDKSLKVDSKTPVIEKNSSFFLYNNLMNCLTETLKLINKDDKQYLRDMINSRIDASIN